ncbi:MAG: diguanylate cyclase [Candidatus Omnitrophica bacterium]|nr:diguanylate cyclase [Candidatus Omnitrophota bacterium]
MEKAKKILIISSEKNLSKVLNICFTGWGYKVHVLDTAVRDITQIKKISPDVIVVDVHSANKANLEVCTLIKDDFITAFIPVITLIDKRQLRMQLLNLKQGVDDYLIKPPDPLDLRARIEMAIRRSQYSFYASPLTGLPGGRIIEEVLKERMKNSAAFSFGYLDIDNFKYFNDSYGYLKGDRIIMQTAYTLYTIIKKFGNSSDFIGHIGGDDFVFITTPQAYKDICHNFILAFDKIIPFHYSSQDRKQGFVLARDRTHKMKKISLMSISIAVVNRDKTNEYHNLIEMNERIAEIKQYLKNIPGSKFMADRRETNSGDYLNPIIYKKEEFRRASYKPLGQILLEKNIISAEQLDEALSIHWRRGIIFGEILKELGFVKEEELEKALSA